MTASAIFAKARDLNMSDVCLTGHLRRDIPCSCPMAPTLTTTRLASFSS
jgi:hypothetical protein